MINLKPQSMAKFKNGVLGPYIGKVGPVIGSSWKGISYVKAKPSKRKKPRKARGKEQANREKFGSAQKWLKPLLYFVREGFRNYTPTVEGFIAAKSLLLKNSFEGEYPNMKINPALVQLSTGPLPLPSDIIVEISEKYLTYSWDPVTSGSTFVNAHPMDQALLLAYDIANQYACWEVPSQFRSSGSARMELDSIPGATYHVYLAFIAHDRSMQSESVYLGEVVVQVN